jgi:gamma-glutamyltranspeptidase/glutathione hydrolase
MRDPEAAARAVADAEMRLAETRRRADETERRRADAEAKLDQITPRWEHAQAERDRLQEVLAELRVAETESAAAAREADRVARELAEIAVARSELEQLAVELAPLADVLTEFKRLETLAREEGRRQTLLDTERAIADELQRLGGIITVEDLARYKPVWREPVRATYRGHTVLSMPPSSSGGVTIAETLNILEGFDSLPAFGSARRAHLLASAYQRAFVDRNEKLADPAFVAVPITELTSKAYAAGLRATIDTARATPTRSLLPPRADGTETTHYSVVDAAGNAVATTTTINALYGSGVYVVGAGFFLNDEMDDFATRPGHPNMFGLVQGEANAVQPGKRMLSAMSPTIVLSPGDSLLLVLGARGGPRIITGTSQVIINVIDHRMTLADAMSAPRLHHQALPDTLRHEMHGLAPAVLDSLSRMNWGVGPTGGVGLVNAIMRVPGGYHGVADPRSGGRALGY